MDFWFSLRTVARVSSWMFFIGIALGVLLTSL
jgi:hypothetical protein